MSFLQRIWITLGAVGRYIGYFWLLPLLMLPFAAFILAKAVLASPQYVEGFEPWAPLFLSYISFEWIAIFSSASLFGALGASTSFFSRTDNEKLGDKRSLLAVQLFGAIFSILLTMMFVAGLIQGSLFPTFGGQRWMDLLFSMEDWAKLLVWSFISGFSERFVPDLLDNLISRSREPDGPDASDG